MHCKLRACAPHRSLIVTMWLLTAVSLFHLPIYSYGLLVSALLSLASNSLALFLLCSPARWDKIHVGVKLALQICFIGFFFLMTLRDPLLLHSLFGIARQLGQ